ncbi:hypothetical protein [Streptomyces altiplanensis]
MKRRLPLTATALAAMTVLATSTAVQAEDVGTRAYRSCAATYIPSFPEGLKAGAVGGGNQAYTGRNSLTDVSLSVSDTLADGHHVAVRLVTRRSNGSDHYWSWRRLYAGNGTSQTWTTTASDSGGIHLVFREVAVFEGSSMIANCITAPERNSFW